MRRRGHPDETAETVWLGEVYQTGDSGPQKPGTHGADADERDAVTPGDVYRVGDSGPQRSETHQADADERTEATSRRRG